MITEKVKEQALKLSYRERAELAHILIASLHNESDLYSEEDWSNELKRRIDNHEKGESSSKPWSEIKKSAQAQLG